MIWKLHGLASMTPVCEQEPCPFHIRRCIALETNFGLCTIAVILNRIPSGWRKVLTLLPNEFGEVVTRCNMHITTNLNRSSVCNKGSLTHPFALVPSNPFL